MNKEKILAELTAMSQELKDLQHSKVGNGGDYSEINRFIQLIKGMGLLLKWFKYEEMGECVEDKIKCSIVSKRQYNKLVEDEGADDFVNYPNQQKYFMKEVLEAEFMDLITVNDCEIENLIELVEYHIHNMD